MPSRPLLIGMIATVGCGSPSPPLGADGDGGYRAPLVAIEAGRGDGASASPSRSDAGEAGSGAPSEGGAGSSPANVWHPTSEAPIHFHWMIGAGTFTSRDILSGQEGAVVYDIDGENATAADVDAIHRAGAVAVCYVDVGSLEPQRSDAAGFPASVVGPAVQGWPGEKWLLVTAANQPTVLALMKARFVDWCQAKGFDAIEPDNLDAWANISGVSQADNLAYDLAIADLAHALPLSVGLKNVMAGLGAADVPTFVAAFDWALNEQCFEYGECSAYSAPGSFLPSRKAVFDVEYNVAPNCNQAAAVHMNAQQTDLALVGAADPGYVYSPCVPDSAASW